MKHNYRINRRLFSFGLVLMLLLIAYNAPLDSALRATAQQPEDARAAQPSETRVEGWLSVIYGDPPLDSGLPAVRLVTLQDSDGTPLVEVAMPEGTLQMLYGQYVEVIGTLSGDTRAVGGAVLNARLVTPIAPQRGEGLRDMRVSGSQPWINLLCRFSDLPTDPNPPPFYQNLFSTAYPGLDHYSRQLSYDNINLSGTATVTQWRTLPQPRSFYVTSSTVNLTALMNDCVSTHDPFVFYPSYVGINAFFNDQIGCCAWGGGSYLNVDGQGKFYRTTWLPPWAANHAIVAHEMGHGFGFPHSTGPANNPPTGMNIYVSQWDVMSVAGGTGTVSHSGYGILAPGTISYHLRMAGWIPSGRIVTVAPGQDVTLTLERIVLPQPTTNPLMAVVPIGGSANRFYTVEVRNINAGYDQNIPASAVIIHDVDTTRTGNGGHAYVVDADINNVNPNDEGARWLPGETYVDSARGIRITVLGQSGSTFTVRIINNSVTDIVPPNLIYPLPNAVLNSRDVTFTWASADAPGQIGYNLRINQSSDPNAAPYLADVFLQSSALSYSHTFPADGVYHWHMRTRTASSTSNWVTRQLTVDSTPPTVTITNPPGGGYVNANLVTIEANASDELSGMRGVDFFVGYDDNIGLGLNMLVTDELQRLTPVPQDSSSRSYLPSGWDWYYLGRDSDGSDGWSMTWNASGVADQWIAFHVYADDQAGNYRGATNWDIRLDRTPPTVTITNPPGGGYVNANLVTIEANASDELSGMRGVDFFVGYDDNIGLGLNMLVTDELQRLTPVPQDSSSRSYLPSGWDWYYLGRDSDGSDGWSMTWNASGVADQWIAFHVYADDQAGNYRGATNWDIRLDRTPPQSSVNSLPATSPPTFIVNWSGSDNLAGIASFDVQYRVNNGSWVTWQSATTNTSAAFTGSAGSTYSFRSRARDYAGNLEAYPDAPDATTAVVVPPSNDLFANARAVSPGETYAQEWYGATNSATDPIPSCAPFAGTVWFRFTAPSSGSITIDTLGTTSASGGVDTVLAVYTGTEGNLTQVACNDDIPSSLLSRVTYSTQQGTTYHIVVGRFGSTPPSESTTLRLNLSLINLVRNGDFTNGGAPPNTPPQFWSIFGAPINPVWNVTGGVFQFYRQLNSTQGVVFQNLNAAIPSGTLIEARVDLGNSSGQRKRAVIILHDANFSDLFVCSFWLPPNTPLTTFRMRGRAQRSWANATISIYASMADNLPHLRVDNVLVSLIPDDGSRSVLCYDPFAP